MANGTVLAALKALFSELKAIESNPTVKAAEVALLKDLLKTATQPWEIMLINAGIMILGG